MSEQEKKNDKECMIYRNQAKKKKKENFRNNWSFFMASIKPRP